MWTHPGLRFLRRSPAWLMALLRGSRCGSEPVLKQSTRACKLPDSYHFCLYEAHTHRTMRWIDIINEFAGDEALKLSCPSEFRNQT